MAYDWRRDREKAARELLTLQLDRSSFVMAGPPESPRLVKRWEPAQFATSLLECMLRADQQNLALLGLGFPAYAQAVDIWKNDPHGVERLRERAGWTGNTPTPIPMPERV